MPESTYLNASDRSNRNLDEFCGVEDTPESR
jgi:hypothetical protein